MGFALRMDSGVVLWRVKVSEFIGPDATGTGAHKGIVIASTHGKQGGGDSQVTALNATDGKVGWMFKADAQLWNFMPFFTSDDKVIFQDQIGGVYCVGLTNGNLIWKNGYRGGWGETWTDGTPMLGPNGIVYAVHMSGNQATLSARQSGDLSAYKESDGSFLWRRSVPYPPNPQPLILARPGGGGL